MPISTYKQRFIAFQEEANQLKKQIAFVGWLRLLFLVLAGVGYYFSYNSNQTLLIAGIATIALGLFLFLVFKHFQLKAKHTFASTLMAINSREISFLETGSYPFYNGSDFKVDDHAYLTDLDILGDHSIYQHLNRTATITGKRKLADALLVPKDQQTIQQRQEAIKELTELLEWRQTYKAHAEIGADTAENLKHISEWKSLEKLSIFHQISIWLFPALGLSSMIALAVTSDGKWFTVGILLFIFNLVIFGSVAKKILAELGQLERLDKTFDGYGKLLSLIETHNWKSELLQNLNASIQSKGVPASEKLKQLGKIFRSLESIRNGFAMIHFNGTIFYHVHAYKRLIKWRKLYSNEIMQWIDVIGDFEELIAFSNFKHNNPSYCFPILNNEFKIQFSALGHPLLNSQKRINNDIDFSEHPFVILTGSNMSGKSTFLRTIGIGIVLGNAGSVVAAKSAQLHPIPLVASMRLSDSLSDSESYFFAEVKRLQFIMETLEQKRCFVLLDEILRGTNSDDKRNGTIEVVKQLVAKKGIGIIATHDLEVCETTQLYPDYLSNNCFEVEIKDNDLYFDYTLRNGICKNKSATFIMKKLKVI